jgi:hypothetical protein
MLKVNPTCVFVLGVVQAVAANGLGNRVSVVHRDVAKLERGHEVRRLGVNLVVADFFDAGAPPTVGATTALLRSSLCHTRQQ